MTLQNGANDRSMSTLLLLGDAEETGELQIVIDEIEIHIMLVIEKNHDGTKTYQMTKNEES